MKHLKRRFRELNNQRGSALLVSLMVMVGLSLLGLGYVTISETEHAIAANERNYNQALAVGEAGSNAIVEMFQSPVKMEDGGFLPPNLAVFKNDRWIDKSGTLTNIGHYKGVSSERMFDKPFSNEAGRFYCSEEYPDVLIDRSTKEGIDYLEELSSILLTDTDGGEISEIRVYAPPIVGGGLNTQKCYDGGTRYGLATIKVTSTRYTGNEKTDATTIAQREVTSVIAEWPFPGPQGPIQSNANISTGGNLGVHWGKMTSEGDLEFANPWQSLPWFDATNRVHFEHGFDSSVPWAATTALPVDRLIHPPTATLAATPALKQFSYKVTVAGTTDAAEPAWGTTMGNTFTDGTVTYITQWATEYPNENTKFENQHDWLYALIERQFQDPWMEVRAKGDLTNVAGSVPHPYKYNSPFQDPTAVPNVGYSSWFEDQDQTLAPDKLEVVFPTMDYEFWKEIATTGRSEDGVFYLRHVTGEDYTDGVSTRNVAEWTNTHTKRPAGFYFFDTANKLNPQGDSPAGILAPAVHINSSDDGSTYQAQGFIYLNAVDFGTSGIGGVKGWQHVPGEPYRDIGFRKVDEITGDFVWDTTTNSFEYIGINTGEWEFQDLPFSNGATTPNGQFDVFVAPKTVTRPDGAVVTVYLPVPYTPGCNPGMTGTAGANCSEPHEPYLNLVYNDTARQAGIGSDPEPFLVSFDPAKQTYYPKELDDAGKPVVMTCTSASDPNDCTSLRFDNLGAVVEDLEPFLQGVLYNEGSFENTTGNATYYGSLLINGNVGKAGTAQVWFDEKLVKGMWPPDSFNFPRVLVTSRKTDE